MLSQNIRPTMVSVPTVGTSRSSMSSTLHSYPPTHRSSIPSHQAVQWLSYTTIVTIGVTDTAYSSSSTPTYTQRQRVSYLPLDDGYIHRLARADSMMHACMYVGALVVVYLGVNTKKIKNKGPETRPRGAMYVGVYSVP